MEVLIKFEYCSALVCYKIKILINLCFSFISGISLLGTPTELYIYGTAYLFSFIGTLIMSIVVFYTFLPVLYDLQLTSAYEVKLLFKKH